jgi:hypothetical protein
VKWSEVKFFLSVPWRLVGGRGCRGKGMLKWFPVYNWFDRTTCILSSRTIRIAFQNLIQLYTIIITYCTLLAWRWPCEFKTCRQIRAVTLASCVDFWYQISNIWEFLCTNPFKTKFNLCRISRSSSYHEVSVEPNTRLELRTSGLLPNNQWHKPTRVQFLATSQPKPKIAQK